MAPSETNAVPAARTPSGMPLAVVVALFLLVFYVLSTGPAVKLESHGYVSLSTLERVYAPVIWLAENSPPVGRVLRWYLEDVWKWN